jgi:uncharacterized protein
MTNSEGRINSPCVSNCCLDDKDICLGCFRSLPEITGWMDADNNTRAAYLANTEQRRLEYSQKYNNNW